LSSGKKRIAPLSALAGALKRFDGVASFHLSHAGNQMSLQTPFA
jgi:hypothetical protein